MMAALMVATLTVSAQDYNWAVGVRGGGFSGLTVKKNNGGNALEFGASWNWNNNINVDGVYLWQQPVIADGFTLYYGAGAYVGMWEHEAASAFALGAEGVGKDVNMLIGNGYTKGHANAALQVLREDERIMKLFAELYA